jgi:LacI family transcriptional regulator
MRDVAALADVGVMTVSRVVNGRGGVGPERAARVWHAIEQLDYRHNHTARNLRLTGQATATIGVLVEDVGNPFSAELLRAIEKVVSKHNCLVMCASSDGDAERERALLTAFCTRRVDGLIVVPCAPDHRYLVPEMRRGTPVVFADRPPGAIAADTVLSDNFGGAVMAVTHLLAHGHTRIGFIGDRRRLYTAAERFRGYLAALTEGGIKADAGIIQDGVHSSTSAELATRELLGSAPAPTAIFTAQNLLTIGACSVLQSMGRARDIAQIGFAQMLLHRIRFPDSVPETILLPVRLIARGSGELPLRPRNSPTQPHPDPPVAAGGARPQHATKG